MPIDGLKTRSLEIEKWLASYLLGSQLFSTSFEELYDRVSGTIRRSTFFKIEGCIGNSNETLSIITSGQEETSRAIAALICGESERLHPLGSYFTWQNSNPSEQDADVAMLCVQRQHTRKLEKQGHFILPSVTFSLDLNGSMDEIIARMSGRRRKEIRKLPRYGYSYSISKNNAAEFDHFYWNMYLPYTKKRFRKAAYLQTYLTLKSIYHRKGGILFVTWKKTPISALLFTTRGKTILAKSLGVHSGDQDLLRDYAAQATLFFLIEWAKTQGFRKLDYGETLPFLNDGIFTYKKQWGMHMENIGNRSFCSLKTNRINEPVLLFLRENPFVFQSEGSMKALITLDHKLTEAEAEQIASSCLFQGLNSAIIISYEKPANKLTDEHAYQAETSIPNLPKPVQELITQLRKHNFTVTSLNLNRERSRSNTPIDEKTPET